MLNGPVEVDASDLCFGCGRNNPCGLKLDFQWDGKVVRSEFTTREMHQGWKNVIHGGILTALLDETMAYALCFEKVVGVTASIEVRFKSPVTVGEHLFITAWVSQKTRRLAETRGEIARADGTVVTEAKAAQFLSGKPMSFPLSGNASITFVNQKGAVIWDMDGVIANTAAFHYAAWQDVLGKWGVVYTKEAFQQNFGKRNDTIIKSLMGGRASQQEMEAVMAAKEARYRERARGKVQALPGAVELIQALRGQCLPQALASSAPMENIQLVLEDLGIEGYFQVIVSGHEVAEGKPSPLCFLLAAERLGVKPEDCLVIEDAVAGVSAAKSAGMRCLAVTTSNSKENLVRADLVVASLCEVTTADIEKLIASP